MNLAARYISTCRAAKVALVVVGALVAIASDARAQQSVARQWDEALLSAIRIDKPAPTIHSRNLYHTSAAMYDAWAAFDDTATGDFFTEKFSGVADVDAARNEAISYAAYRVLSQRYTHAANPVASQAIFDNLLTNQGYDKNFTSTVGNAPAAIGNRIAQQILSSTLNDGSNEANNYVDNTGYAPQNVPMVVDYPAIAPFGQTLANPNAWQPLYIDSFTLQNGIPVGSNLQTYLGPHWGNVETFAMGREGTSGPYSWSDIDPGAPPQLGDAEFTAGTMEVIRRSGSLDPTHGPGAETINISPSVYGNRSVGSDTNQGYAVNPVTNQPYAPNVVKVADYGRVLAEFWADGPQSETPPGHWNVLANQVADNPLLEKRIGGAGPVVSNLEWDVKTYFALNGAVHDAAVAAWGAKREYDYVRPISMIRYQGSLGQSSDSNLPSYNPNGLQLEADLVELITAETIAPGGRHYSALVDANVDYLGDPFQWFTPEQMIGKIAILTWHGQPDNPGTELGGVDWILAENWVPFQRDTFVTPAFAAYVSGHSTFSRAAAEVMALMTGSEYFPGGLGEMTFDTDFLHFEDGPEGPVTLQWATYFDAADEAGNSRRWGGIHVMADDYAGRIMGSSIGQDAYGYALSHFGPLSEVPEPASVVLAMMGAGALCTLAWRKHKRRVRK